MSDTTREAVERFDCDFVLGGMESCEDGSYVSIEDYRVLFARIRELEAENVALLEKLRAAQEENRWAYIEAAMEDRDTTAPVPVGEAAKDELAKHFLDFARQIAEDYGIGEDVVKNDPDLTDACNIYATTALRAIVDKGDG